MGAGVLAIVYGLISFAVGKGDEPGPLDILVILAMVLEVVGLVGFHTLQGRNYGRIGRAGLYTTIGSIVLFELLLLASLLGGDVSLGGLVAVGVLGTLVGFVLYGAATLQARVLPRWCGILLIILVPVGSRLGDLQPIWDGLVGARVRTLVEPRFYRGFGSPKRTGKDTLPNCYDAQGLLEAVSLRPYREASCFRAYIDYHLHHLDRLRVALPIRTLAY